MKATLTDDMSATGEHYQHIPKGTELEVEYLSEKKRWLKVMAGPYKGLFIHNDSVCIKLEGQ